MANGSYITGLGEVKQEIHNLKSGSESSINQGKLSIGGKFNKIN